MTKKTKNEKFEITESSGNVYADLSFTNPKKHLAKAQLAQLIIDAIDEKKLNQKEAAKLMGIDQPKVSAILRGNFSGFSIDRLFRLLLALGMDIFIGANLHKQKTSEPSIYVMPEFVPPRFVESRPLRRVVAA